MITFPHIRTRRISVRLRELRLDDSIAILKLPGDRHELCTTELLRRIADQAQAPRPGYVTDPRLWTLEERALLVCNYLMLVSDDGPDFSVGEGTMSSYVELSADLSMDEVALGKIGDVECAMRPMLGLHAEVLESMCTNRLEWVIGAMAVQIIERGAAGIEWADLGQADLIKALRDRMATIRALPESEFEAMLAAFFSGQSKLYHFMHPVIGDDGVTWARLDQKEGAGMQPARFRPISCISPATRGLFGGDALEAA